LRSRKTEYFSSKFTPNAKSSSTKSKRKKREVPQPRRRVIILMEIFKDLILVLAQPKLNAAKGSNAAKLMDFDEDEEEEYVPRGRNDLYDDFM